MNPLTNVKNTQKLNERELELGLTGSTSSWHADFKDSAWIFVGGLPYELTEGDVICVFSQYGEIVHINLVRDKGTGKSKGFCFVCYEDQRSTVLAVDNFNGIKLLNRTLRVNHVADYKMPKEHEEDDEVTRQLRDTGCAPKLGASAPLVGDQHLEEEEEEILIKKKTKKEKKKKKDKKKKKKKKRESSESESEAEQEASPQQRSHRSGQRSPDLGHRSGQRSPDLGHRSGQRSPDLGHRSGQKSPDLSQFKNAKVKREKSDLGYEKHHSSRDRQEGERGDERLYPKTDRGYSDLRKHGVRSVDQRLTKREYSPVAREYSTVAREYSPVARDQDTRGLKREVPDSHDKDKNLKSRYYDEKEYETKSARRDLSPEDQAYRRRYVDYRSRDSDPRGERDTKTKLEIKYSREPVERSQERQSRERRDDRDSYDKYGKKALKTDNYETIRDDYDRYDRSKPDKYNREPQANRGKYDRETYERRDKYQELSPNVAHSSEDGRDGSGRSKKEYYSRDYAPGGSSSHKHSRQDRSRERYRSRSPQCNRDKMKIVVEIHK